MTLTSMTTAKTDNQAPTQDLYRDLVLDHAKTPRNFRHLENATHKATGINALCGDKLHIYAVVDAEGRLHDLSFEGSGCAISIASASLLTESLTDLNLTEATQSAEALMRALGNEDAASAATHDIVNWSQLRALEGVRAHPSRVKCATLAWQTLSVALSQSATVTTTE